MKASAFAKRILNNLLKEDKMLNFEFKMLEELCMYSHKKKLYTYYSVGRRIRIWGDFYKYDNVVSFYNKLGVKTEIVDDGSLCFNSLHITNNTFRNIKPFLDEIREYFKKNYKFVVEIDKFDGEVSRISLPCGDVTKEKLLKAIHYIANSNY